MHVISKRTLVLFAEKHADAYGPLMEWYAKAEAGTWSDLQELRRTFPHADGFGKTIDGKVRTYTIINIAGNKYRLVAGINYRTQTIFIKRVMTHAEYSKNRWKDQL